MSQTINTSQAHRQVDGGGESAGGTYAPLSFRMKIDKQ